MTQKLDIFSLRHWFAAAKRDLPWRQTNDPYAIWISEVMLQQTQVSVVIPYFLCWMERFPSIQQLAQAHLDEVLKVWEGLGYYSRARNLHEAANYLVERHQGCLPAEEEALKQIKGLGPYTVGAILSFAFRQKKAAVDGNVLRVLTRYFGSEEDISKPSVVGRIRQLAQELLPDEEPWVVNEALIELGATVCQKKARCSICPLQGGCSAYREGKVNLLPFNSKKVKVEKLYRFVAVVQSGSYLLVRRGKKGEIMSDLYEFPYCEMNKEKNSQADYEKALRSLLPLSLLQRAVLSEVAQGFTRYQARLFPILYLCQDRKEVEGYEWLSCEVLRERAFSSGHRRIFQQASDLLQLA